jgi:uncharacterized membrane protein (UPF0182 family)
MRPADDMPRRERRRRRSGSNRGRILLIFAAIALFVLITSLRAIASFYTDYLWFRSIGQTGVWRGVLGTKLVLAGVFIGVFFVLMWVSLFIADRLAPKFRPTGPEEELIERYHDLISGHVGLVRIGVAALFAVIAGAPASSQWNEWLLFRNRVSFGSTDPQFHKDIGFYVFQLPFLTFLVGWLFAAFVIVFIVTAVAHYLNGGIRVQTPFQRVTPQVKAHLSVLLAVLALVKLGGYYLQQFQLTTSTRGTIDGATYTDVHVQLPAIQLLMLISLAAATLFILNIFRRGWVLPVLGVGLWAFVAIIAGSILPAIIQKFRVEPSESSKERPYIERNIAATQEAIGLAKMSTVPFASDNKLTAADVTGTNGNQATLDNIRLWDPASNILGKTFQQLQNLRPFYNIGDVDVDRYTINGKKTQVMISARELNTSGVPQSSWEATHLAFTHGYGVVAAPSNDQTATGDPAFLVKDIPVANSDNIKVDESAIYFGENLSGYVVVNTKREEIDFQKPDGSNSLRNYAGQDGIDIGSIVNKAAFALRFGDFNPLVSGNLTGGSKILINRDIRSRVQAIAPFLSFDRDPYPVVVGGRIEWVVDGYTSTDRYPYAQRAITDGGSGDNGLGGQFNYARNSVKAVVDAYDGTITLYVKDATDPIIQAYQKAFPSLFTTTPAPAELEAHFRYPEELFRVQTNMWARYHETNPDTFYNQSNGWIVAPDPGQQVKVAAATPIDSANSNANANVPPSPQGRIPPYYLLMQLPGDAEQSFVLLRSFVPVQGNNQQLTAFMVASSDPATYGQLRTFVMPSNNLPPSPGQVASKMSSDPTVSSLQTQLGIIGGGSDLLFGNLITVPIQQSLLFVRPVYVQATNNPIPQLRKVVVEFNGQVAVDDTLPLALKKLDPFKDLPASGARGTPSTTTPGSTPTTPDLSTPAQLLADANRLFDEANAALAKSPPDFATYQSKTQEGRAKIQQAADLLNGASSSTTTTPSSTTTSSTTTTTAVGTA